VASLIAAAAAFLTRNRRGDGNLLRDPLQGSAH
jgi:hypothetical protein